MSDYQQTHLQEPEFLLFGSRVTRFCERPVSVIKTPTWFFTWMSTCKGDTGNGLPIAFLLESRKKPQASCQANSFLTHRQEKKPQESTRTSWPQEKGLEKSAPTHARHTHCTHMHLGTTANWSMTFLKTDFEKRAIWQGSVEMPAAKVFVARKVRTIDFYKVSGTSWNASRCKDHLRRHLAAVFQTSNNQPYLWGWKSVHDSSPGLYCVDLVEDYVTRENVSSRISREKVWFAFAQRTFAQETFTEKGETGRESRY